MALLPLPSSCCHHHHHAAPFFAPVAASLARPRWGALRLAAAAGRSVPASGTPMVAPLQTPPAAVDKRRCECFDLHQQIVPYAEAYAWQKSIVKRRGELAYSGEDHSDTLIALQHPPVYTLGTDSSEEYLHFKKEDAPFELVMYPILNLRYHKEDVRWYLRSLEEVIIRALKSAFSIKATRVEGLTGVWIEFLSISSPGNQKVAAIGIHGSRMIVYHGLALNVTTDLTPFQMIDPCGIKDRGVGSIKQILQMASQGREIDDTLLMDIAYHSMIKEFAELFQLDLDINSDCSFQ
nr:unnamed protein product [Digitaria exilis]